MTDPTRPAAFVAERDARSPRSVLRLGVGATAGALLTLAVVPAIAMLYGPGWSVPVIGAVVGAAVVTVAVRLLVDRGAALVLIPTHLSVAVVWCSIAVRPAIDGAAAVAGLPDGVARLLTSLPPVDARGPELSVAVAATWLAAALAVSAATSRRPGLAVAVGPLALLVGALAMADPRRTIGDRVPMLMLAVLGAIAVATTLGTRTATATAATTAGPAGSSGGEADMASVTRRRGRGPTTLLRFAAGLVVVAVAIAVGVSAAPHVPGLAQRPRLDLRAQQHPPVRVLAGENPIDLVPARRRAPKLRFTAQVRLPRGADREVHWRLAVLDEVSSAGWRPATARFRRIGRQVAVPEGDEAVRRAVATANVRFGAPEPDLPLLPSIDRPIGVSESGLAFDARSGELAIPEGRARPTSLQLRAAVPLLSASDLATATATLDSRPDPLLAPFAARAQAVTKGVVNPLARLALLQRSLQTDPSLRLNDKAVRLTSIKALTPLVDPTAKDLFGRATTPSGRPRPGAQAASPHVVNTAQLAATFALMARSEGFRARLVVGYISDIPRSGRGTVRVTDESLTVWAEVRFDRIGWVPFVLSARTGREQRPRPGRPPSKSVVDKAAEQQAKVVDANRNTKSSKPSGEAIPSVSQPPRSGTRWLWLLVVPAVLLLLAALLGPAVRARRRRVRRRGSPTARLLGAWAELVDRLRDAGAPVGRSNTRPEVADVVRDHVSPIDAGDVGWLAGAADAAAFGPSGAPMAADDPATHPDVERAWTVAQRVGRTARAGQGAIARARTAVAPPSVFTRTRPSVVRVGVGAGRFSTRSASRSRQR